MKLIPTFTKWALGLALVLSIFSLISHSAFAFQTDTSYPAVDSPAGAHSSYNWSGYAAGNGTYTGVSGTWVVPKATSPTSLGSDAAWVGIGGVSHHDLIQAGTLAITNSSGDIQYQSWYELLPNEYQPLPVDIHAGDSVTVSINEQSPDQWQIFFKDNTTGAMNTTDVSYASSHSSAEWIEEMPLGNGRLIPLDNFGSITFTNATVVKDGKTITMAEARAEPLTMTTRDNQALAVPSTIGSDNSSFSVSRTQVAALTQPNFYSPYQSYGPRSGRNGNPNRSNSTGYSPLPGVPVQVFDNGDGTATIVVYW